MSSAGGTGAGAGAATSVVVDGVMEKVISDESRFSGGWKSGIVGATGRTGSGSGAGSFEALEVKGTSGYGSAGIGGSTETDLDRATRWEGGEGDREGNRNESGFGCGGTRCEDRLVGLGLGSGRDSDGGSGCGGSCSRGAGGSMFMGSVVAALLGRGGVDDSDRSDGSREARGVRGDMDPASNRVFCTDVFGSALSSRLNGSSSREPEVEAITKVGRGCPKFLRTFSTFSTTILGTGVLSKSLSTPHPTPTPSLPSRIGDEGGTDIIRTLYALFVGERYFDKSRCGTRPGVVGIEGGTDLARGDEPMFAGVVEPEAEDGGSTGGLLEVGNA